MLLLEVPRVLGGELLVPLQELRLPLLGEAQLLGSIGAGIGGRPARRLPLLLGLRSIEGIVLGPEGLQAAAFDQPLTLRARRAARFHTVRARPGLLYRIVRANSDGIHCQSLDLVLQDGLEVLIRLASRLRRKGRRGPGSLARGDGLGHVRQVRVIRSGANPLGTGRHLPLRGEVGSRPKQMLARLLARVVPPG